jgi:hypothetical protein
MAAIAGNEPGFEESIRALYRVDAAAFERSIESWPEDVREHSRTLAQAALQGEPASLPSGNGSAG